MKEKIKNILKKSYKWIILLICVIILYAILENLFETEKLKIDTIIYEIIVLKFRTNTLTEFMKIFTNVGGAYVLITLSILALIFLKNKKMALSININLVVITILNIILKSIIQRPRPEGYRLIDESGYSFPSGHSMISMAFYGLIIYYLWKNVKNKKIKYISVTLLTLMVLLIGISRIYLGVHYASDVLGGFIISIAYLIVFITIEKLIYRKNNKNKERRNNETRTEN